MYGGSSKTELGGLSDFNSVDRNAADFSGSLYMYGDEGHDVIWGSKKMQNEYLSGGAGDDIIYPG